MVLAYVQMVKTNVALGIVALALSGCTFGACTVEGKNRSYGNTDSLLGLVRWYPDGGPSVAAGAIIVNDDEKIALYATAHLNSQYFRHLELKIPKYDAWLREMYYRDHPRPFYP